jgi:6-phosphogluconate dehydrogenase
MVERLLKGGHRVVVYNRSPEPTRAVAAKGAVATFSLPELVKTLTPPRAIWIMVPSGAPVDQMINALLSHVSAGDILIDGGNSNYHDSMRRAEALKAKNIDFLDTGTSGGIWGLKVGYCLMIGGEEEAFRRLEPVFKTLAPEDGYLHVGPSGAGHFTKMIHNGIEYGMLQAYGEGFEILKASPFKPDLGKVAHLWNRGSVVRSWLLELAELAFSRDPDLTKIKGYVEDSGEGRWTIQEAIDRDVPAPVLALSLFARFRSRQDDSFAAKVIAALRNEFGGHSVKPQ